MKLFNTKSNQLEDFQPINPNRVMMYVCGPTVYNHAHIGNARPIAVFDTLKKTLEAKGYDVQYVSNFTDIDDKIIQKALDEAVNEQEIASRYIEAYKDVRKALHAHEPDATPQVTNNIDSIIEFIQLLVDKNYAYQVGDNVYFRVNSVSDYGSLSHQNLEMLQSGSRVEENSDKENPLDFVLWKKTDDQGIKWESPWGSGRPGWHTECVVMIQNEFGTSQIDIHGGGQDLKFPHHENESAQNSAIHHHPLANYWVHNGMINIDGEKMSKSLGNVWWAKEAIEKLGSNVSRWILVQNHYRQTINMTEESITTAQVEIEKFQNGLKQAHLKLQLSGQQSAVIDQELYSSFLSAMEDDLNTPNAIVTLFEGLKKLNQLVRVKEIDVDLLSSVYNFLVKGLYILGIDFNLVPMKQEDINLYQQWTDAKKEKNFDLADKLRNSLVEIGIL